MSLPPWLVFMFRRDSVDFTALAAAAKLLESATVDVE